MQLGKAVQLFRSETLAYVDMAAELATVLFVATLAVIVVLYGAARLWGTGGGVTSG